MEVYEDALMFLMIAVAFAFVAAVLAVKLFRLKRAAARRVVAVAARLESGGEPSGGRKVAPLDETLARLERAAEDRVLDASDIGSAADRLRLTLTDLPHGLVVCDEHRRIALRNPAAIELLQLGEGHEGPAEDTVSAAVARVLEGALAGRRTEESVSASGPPSRELHLCGIPLDDGLRNVGAAVMVEDRSERLKEAGSRRELANDLTRQLVEPMVALGILADAVIDEPEAVLRERMAERLRAESARCRKLVDDIVELGSLTAAERRPTERVPVETVLRRALEAAHPHAQRRLISFRVGAVPARLDVIGERHQVETAVGKLVEHALDGARAGSTLELAVRVVPSGQVEIEANGPTGAAGLRPGLSIAVVEQAARNLGGELDRQGDATSTVWRLRLPAGPSSLRVEAG
jgi:signal transduction histidine kinase